MKPSCPWVCLEEVLRGKQDVPESRGCEVIETRKIKTPYDVKISSSTLSLRHLHHKDWHGRVHGDVLDQDPPRMRPSVTW